jgi:hypothetical protein
MEVGKMLSFVIFFQHLLFMLPFLALSLWATWKVKSTFAKYSKVRLRSGLSGLEAARMVLEAAGIDDVSIRPAKGILSDHYNPLNKTVNLSQEVLQGRSAAAVGVAAHEVGHAIQHARAWAPMKWRNAFVPVANIGSSLGVPMIIIGMFLGSFGATLALLGVILFAGAVLFHLVTLPVEFDASRRAVAILGDSGAVTPEELGGVKKTLMAAGFTYVAAALVAMGELLFWVLQLGLLGEE